jgi:murein DD-endopeptidase MepM/ murein hydrolase activator NlpD
MPTNALAAAAAAVLVPATAVALVTSTPRTPDRPWPSSSVTAAQPVVAPGSAPPTPLPGERWRAVTPVQPYRAGSAAEPARGWRWPLSPRPAVVRGFTLGRYTWSAGHRGVDLATGRDAAVLAPADGVVTFVRRVVDRPVLVISHAGGIRTTYEPVTPTVATGSAVTRGSVVGRVTTAPGHCPPRTCLHWGARSGTRYIDPLTLLQPPRIVLLPVPSGGRPRDG